ncbi:regulator of volume decrease after cellular swelling-domain-containing protein [Trichophaea hybrida]|nr:regulator of volume decrease after cellular swelling-domain-containing protein [Trichophaea hybrida]
MPLTIIRSSPEESSYTPLSTFQSETPESFSTPVLHYHQVDSKVLISSDQASLIPIFGVQGTDSSDSATEIPVDGIDLWVTNENLILFNKPLSVGAVVPYLSLTLHAIQQVGTETGLYMQISLTPDISNVSNSDEYDDEELLELTLIPKATEEDPQSDIANAIFKALSLCTSLHSAASNSEDEDGEGEDRILFEGDRDEPRLQGFPGEGGWITAENVDQFRFDDAEDDGSTAILGPGAGVVRRREGDEEDAVAESADGVEELKWRRTG